MKQLSIVFFLFLLVSTLSIQAQLPHAQRDTSWKKVYRETPARINNLIHTRLEVKPDFSKSYLYGKAWLKLRPHFYPTDTLILDAKGFELKKVAIVKGTQQVPLKYGYNELELRIQLDKTYKQTDSYTIFIDYVAKPDE